MTTTVHSDPTPGEASTAIATGLASDSVIIVCCKCDVEYDGRAGGYLPTGNRTILIKPDGNFLVNGSTKHKPRNWQPTGAETLVRADEDTLVLRSVRTSPKEEEIIVYCDDVYELIVYEAGEDPDVTLTGTEDDMHERIMDNPEVIEEGFTALEHEKTVEYGSIDVFGEDADGTPVIIEVKRRRGQLKDVDQLKRYTDLSDDEEETARGVLVAPSASESVIEALDEKGLEYLEMQPRSDESE